MPERILLSKEGLVEILNQELLKYPECEGVSVSYPPDRLATPDESGCNWSDVIVFRGLPAALEECRRTTAAIISRLATQYNLR